MDRKNVCLWMKDVLEHAGDCCDQLADSPNERFLAEAIERDLEELRRLCAALKEQSRPALRRQTAAAA